jgi:hypothetical protein
MDAKRWKGLCAAGGMMLAALMLVLAGCDDDRYDHEPPEGQGALYVENTTGDRVRVYIDGAEQERVRAGKNRYYDLDPGTRRLVLDGDDVQRSWVGDVEILEGRRTILEVRVSSVNYGRFEVYAYFD